MNIHSANNIGTECVYILNRQGGTNLQGVTWHRLIKKSISCANTIGAVTVSSILFIQIAVCAYSACTSKKIVHKNNFQVKAAKNCNGRKKVEDKK